MSAPIEVRMPKYPECWESCGNCAQGDVFVLELLAKPGDTLERDDNILTLETGKVALDIPCPHAGTVVEVFVTEGDILAEGALLLTLAPV
ncbi:MAG: dihydrolipoamide acyltransferase [Betaproteobacteria bacterium]|nr:dihydrolipoamide acyltransferase [Betaproteobacteria bacterium]